MVRSLPEPRGGGPAPGGQGLVRRAGSLARRRPWPVSVLLATIFLALLPGTGADAQATRTLRIFPSPVVVAPGESVEVSAWFCRLPTSGDAFGADGQPGTDDDACEKVKVGWSVEDARIARARPQQAVTTRVTGRRDGLTTLTASYQATSTSSFVTRIGVDVAEPLEATVPDADAGDGAVPTIQGLPVGLFIQPGFVVLAPGDSQIFTAHLCPILDGDPRGPDGVPGTRDDLCRPFAVTWSVLGDPPVGTVEPVEGYHTAFTADGEAQRDTAFVSFEGAGRRTAAAEGEAPEGATTPGSADTMSGTLHGASGPKEGDASIVVDRNAERRPERRLGDTDGDGDVDELDFVELARHFLSEGGDSAYDPASDLNDDGVIGFSDLDILIDIYESA